MTPHQHPTNNDVLGAPRGVSIEDCTALAITRVQFGPGGPPGVASFWRPDTAELQLLNAGASVRLSIHGNTHAPVYVGVDGDGVML